MIKNKFWQKCLLCLDNWVQCHLTLRDTQETFCTIRTQTHTLGHRHRIGHKRFARYRFQNIQTHFWKPNWRALVIGYGPVCAAGLWLRFKWVRLISPTTHYSLGSVLTNAQHQKNLWTPDMRFRLSCLSTHNQPWWCRPVTWSYLVTVMGT